jgi:outer membrane protein
VHACADRKHQRVAGPLGARMIAVIFAAVVARADADAYNVDDAVAYALAHNPNLGAAHAQAAAAGARARAAESTRMPRIDVHYGVRRSDNPLDAFADKLNTRSVDPASDFSADALNHPAASTLHNAGIALEWPVYTGGRVAAGISEARHSELAATASYARNREVVAAETVTAYRRAQAADAAVAIADDAVRAAERHAATTARLAAQHRIVVSDKLTAEVNLALIRASRERAVTARLDALTRLKHVMGLPFDAAVEIAPWDDAAITAPPTDTLEAMEDRAAAQRRDVAAERARFEAARARVAAARAAGKPHVSVIASENWYDDTFGLGNNSYAIGATARFNLYDGGRDREETLAAQYEADGSDQRLRALERQVRQEVREAYYALNDARARLAIGADNADKAQRTVELVRARYGEGRTILLDLLQAERALVETRTERLSAALDLAVAAAQLKAAEGAFALPGE